MKDEYHIFEIIKSGKIEAIKAALAKVENLDFSHYNFCGTRGLLLAEALKSSNTALTQLSIRYNSIEAADYDAINKAIARNSKLKQVQGQVLAAIQSDVSDASDGIVITRKLLYQYQHFTSDLKMQGKNDSIDAYISKNYFQLTGVCKVASNDIENHNVQYGLLSLLTDIMQDILSYLWTHSHSPHLLPKKEEREIYSNTKIFSLA